MVLHYNCGMWLISSFVHNAPIVTYDLIITPEQCMEANKTGKKKTTEVVDEIELDIKHGLSKVSYHNRGTSLERDSPSSFDDRGLVKHYTFETLMQQNVLDIDIKDFLVPYQKMVVLQCHSTPLLIIGRHLKIV